MNKKKACFIISTCVLLLLIVAIGPLDIFFHGFFCDAVDYDYIPEEDRSAHVDLAQSDVEVRFKPLKRHFMGFMLYFSDIPEEGTGAIRFTIFDEDGELVDEMRADVEEVPEKRWYRVYTHKGLRKDQIYTLCIAAQDHQKALCLQLIAPGYLGKENLDGNVMIGYAYARSTFAFSEKVLLTLVIIAVWLILSSWLAGIPQVSPVCKYIGMSLLLTVILAWNYMFGSMDDKNTAFARFQVDSETLVTGVIYAEHDGVRVGPYGLGRYTDSLGELKDYGRVSYTDDGWDNGYSRAGARIRIVDSGFSRKVAVVGGYIRFANGDLIQIKDVMWADGYVEISLQAEGPLLYSRYGNISDIRFLGPAEEVLPAGQLEPYVSQYGLQGKVFRHLSRYLEYGDVIMIFHLLCSLATAFVFVLIVLLFMHKYDLLFAICSYIVFWLSPWIVNFARNLYWVEATWFLPMLFGLYCSCKVEDKKCRIMSYIGVFITIAGKCLCGYEYISTIMLGMISFLLVDLIVAASRGDKERCILLSRTVVGMGLAALAGFMIAIAIHGRMRGAGDIIKGIKDIFERDVLRRVGGGDMNELAERYWPSLNASTWETCGKYFRFSTEVVTGMAGNLFPLLCMTPLGIFWCDRHKRCLDQRLPAMYTVSFLTSISWIVLAKPHSYIHTTMNYVLWYFGFVQICVYTVCRKIQSMIKSKERDEGG